MCTLLPICHWSIKGIGSLSNQVEVELGSLRKLEEWDMATLLRWIWEAEKEGKVKNRGGMKACSGTCLLYSRHNKFRLQTDFHLVSCVRTQFGGLEMFALWSEKMDSFRSRYKTRHLLNWIANPTAPFVSFLSIYFYPVMLSMSQMVQGQAIKRPFLFLSRRPFCGEIVVMKTKQKAALKIYLDQPSIHSFKAPWHIQSSMSKTIKKYPWGW